MRRRILLANVDSMIYHFIRELMKNEDTDVSYAMSAATALELFFQDDYCLIIIEIQPSNYHNVEVIRTIRTAKPIPIMVLTPKLTASEKIMLFHAGANTCLEKPVDAALCVAQAHSLSQLYLEATENCRTSRPLIFGTELLIDPMYRYVIIDGQALSLTRTEFDLFFYLASHPGQIFSRRQLYDYVWTDSLGFAGENTVRTHIGNLRKKLAGVGRNYIQNSRGFGYKFVLPSRSDESSYYSVN